GAYNAQFHPDGQRVLSVSNGRAVLIWWVGGSVSLPVHDRSDVRALDVSDDGTKLVTGGERGWAQISEPVTGAPPIVLSGHTAAVVSAAFSPDGRYVATASSDGSARMWSVVTGQPIGTRLKDVGGSRI